MKGFQRSPSGGPEVGGLLFGHRMPDRVRIDAWREIACEHAGGPFFQLSEQDEEALRLLLQDSNGLEVVGWFQSKYWDTRWSQSQNWVFALSPADIDLHKRHFPEPWQVVLIIQRTKSGPLRAGFFFRKENGSLDSMARDFTQVGAVPPVAFERNNPTAFPPMKTIDPVTAPSGAQPAATAEIESTQETSANSAPGIGFGRNENDLLDWKVVFAFACMQACRCHVNYRVGSFVWVPEMALRTPLFREIPMLFSGVFTVYKKGNAFLFRRPSSA
jgi:hypothetical protein